MTGISGFVSSFEPPLEKNMTLPGMAEAQVECAATTRDDRYFLAVMTPMKMEFCSASSLIVGSWSSDEATPAACTELSSYARTSWIRPRPPPPATTRQHPVPANVPTPPTPTTNEQGTSDCRDQVAKKKPARTPKTTVNAACDTGLITCEVRRPIPRAGAPTATHTQCPSRSLPLARCNPSATDVQTPASKQSKRAAQVQILVLLWCL